jgi:hypothetical protein
MKARKASRKVGHGKLSEQDYLRLVLEKWSNPKTIRNDGLRLTVKSETVRKDAHRKAA